MIAKVEHHLGELFPQVGFIVTTLTGPNRAAWSLTSLQQRLFKTGGRLIRHGRYFILQLAQNHLTPHLLGQMFGRIKRPAGDPT